MRIAFFAACLVLVACDSLGVDATADTLEGPLVLAVADLQDLGGSPGAPPTPTLLVATDSIYPCANYALVVDVERSGSTLDLEVQGVEIGAVCATALGPATARIPLDLPEGEYTLRIRHDGALDIYTLRVLADRLELQPEQTAVTRVPEPLAWRTPERSFVYLCGTYTGDEALCDQFRARFEALGALTEIEVPAEGLWPYPRSASGHYYDAPGRVYRYDSEADFQAVKDLLRTFSREVLRNRTGDGLSVMNWTGDAGLSWVYERDG